MGAYQGEKLQVLLQLAPVGIEVKVWTAVSVLRVSGLVATSLTAV